MSMDAGVMKEWNKGSLRSAAEERTAKDSPPAPADIAAEKLVHELQVHQIELEMQNDELRRTQAALEDSRDRYFDLYEFAPVGYLTLSASSLILEANLTASTLLAVERQLLLRQPFTNLVTLDDRERWQHLFNEVGEERPWQSFELALRRGDQRVFHARVNCRRVADARGVLHLTLTDTSEQKQIEDALKFMLKCGNEQPGEDFFRSLARYLGQSLQADGVVIDRFADDGLTAGRQAVYADGVLADDLSPRSANSDGDALEQSAATRLSTLLRDPAGKAIGLIALSHRKPLPNPRLAELLLKLVAPRAASELLRRKAEHALRESEQRLFSERALGRAQEVGRLGSYILELSSQVWAASPMLDRILGMTADCEHTVEGWAQRLYPDDRQVTLDAFRRAVAERGVFDRQYRIVRASDGTVRWMHGLGQIECGEGGIPLRMVGTVQDITERKRSDEATQALLGENTRLVRQLIAVQEHERAELARELHDELSQHLTAIRAFAGAIRRDEAPMRERVQVAAQAIENSAHAIYEVSHRLMEGLHPNILDDAGVVEAIASLLDAWGRQHPEIEWRASLPRQLAGDRAPLRVAIYRIVQECLSNVSRHAGAQRLRVVLATRQRPDGNWLRLIIRDDGAGMDFEAPRAGFGLLGMRERVLSLGGSLQIIKPRGGGTRVRVLLPLF
jgi:PAS domain S-box-containing protein